MYLGTKNLIAIALALLLVGCEGYSRKRGSKLERARQASVSFECDDEFLGRFDVAIIPLEGTAGDEDPTYQVFITPVQYLKDPRRDHLAINVTNQELAFKELVKEVVPTQGKPIFSGYLTVSELETYPLLVLSVVVPGKAWDQVPEEQAALCEIPVLE